MEGRVFGVASLAGACLTGDWGRGNEGRRAAGLSAGLPARAPGPIDWLKFGLGKTASGVRPPWGMDELAFTIAFSSGRKMPEPGLDVLK